MFKRIASPLLPLIKAFPYNAKSNIAQLARPLED